jgi:hypothetical protein
MCIIRKMMMDIPRRVGMRRNNRLMM